MESNTSSLLASDDHGRTSSSEESSSSHSLGWPQQKQEPVHCAYSDISGYVEKLHLDGKDTAKQGESSISEIEMMKARFAKLLLGEDMSGSGNGACTALAISNAITNLCGTVFGQIWRLESLPLEKKAMWRREMQWLLCVSDYIVEFTPTWQTFPDGSKLEVMTCRPRSDLYANLPALRKLDNMLLEILDGFEGMEFWYVDQGIIAPDGGSVPHQEEKWWLPVPRVPPGGLHENSRNHLQRKRDCTNQILKAAMAINGITLAEMEVPGSYLDALAKNGRACLGDLIYRYMTSDQFYPDCLLACLDLSSDHQALEIANRVEASIHLWRQKNAPRPLIGMNRSAKFSWEIVKDLMAVDLEKKDLLADRAESFLLCLKQRFPSLPQSTLDMSKIQNNKDVGKSILESYSRVLESLAFNIVARIDDLLYIDELMKHSDQHSSIPEVGMISRNSALSPFPMPTSGVTPYKTAFTTPRFSPGQQYSEAAMEERSPLTNSSRATRVLTEYLSIDSLGNARGERRGLNRDSKGGG